METSALTEAEFRFGSFGPGYLLRGPRTDIGVVRLRPGDDASNHYHQGLEETFVGIEGTATLWIDCERRYEIGPGDVYRCDPGEMHYFVNNGTENFRALFIKAPYNPPDGVQVPWKPGEPKPQVMLEVDPVAGD